MGTTIALSEYNKRGNAKLDVKEFALLENMKAFGPEKISGAFAALTGREIGLEDVKLAVLILDLTAALTPPAQIMRIGGGGSPSDSPFNWPRNPYPYTATLGSGDIRCAVGFETLSH